MVMKINAKCVGENRERLILKAVKCVKKEFTTQTKGTRFCSKECQGIVRRDRIETKCSYCLKDIEVVKSLCEKNTYNYCNQDCRTEHLKVLMAGENNPNYDRGKFICEQCGKTFERIKSANRGNHVFCSRECYEDHHRQKGRSKEIEVNCSMCNKVVKVWESRLKYTKDIYCSKECARKGYGLKYSGENSPSYNPNLTEEDRITQRKSNDYYLWRKSVFNRDNYTCQACGDNQGGNLNAHHIINYMENEYLRTNVNNGITLCKTCHKDFHDTYGYKNNNEIQLNEFIYTKKQQKP